MYVYTGLEIGGVALQNASDFWGKCESFSPTDSQCLRISFKSFCE